LQNYLAQLKKKYVIFRDLMENSGFGWDDERQIPTAPDDVWDRYLQSHKNAAEFRFSTLPFYQELHLIFSDTH
jgi:hypothetical protein